MQTFVNKFKWNVKISFCDSMLVAPFHRNLIKINDAWCACSWFCPRPLTPPLAYCQGLIEPSWLYSWSTELASVCTGLLTYLCVVIMCTNIFGQPVSVKLHVPHQHETPMLPLVITKRKVIVEHNIQKRYRQSARCCLITVQLSLLLRVYNLWSSIST